MEQEGDGMSILIKGMEMPKNCAECRLWDTCEYINDFDDWVSILDAVEDGNLVRDKNCPLSEVYTPHGRLIDADALWDRMYKYSDNEGAKMPFGDNDFMIHKDSACELIEDAQTIIEAEE